MTLALRYAIRTDLGPVREKNEDSGYAGPYLLAVADGMGGMPAGDLASAITIAAIRRLDEPPQGDLTELLAAAIVEAKTGIAERVRQDPSLDGMGTTLTATLFDGARVGLAHIGDSRGYLLRDGRLEQVTRDHSFVQSLVDEGRITAEEARTHPYRAAVVRVIDARQDGEPDITVLELRAGDRLLLCSDGLLVAGSEQIRAALAVATPDEAAAGLVRLALGADATDNITVVVGEAVDVDGGPDAAAARGGWAGPAMVGAAAVLAAGGLVGDDERDITANQDPVDDAGPAGHPVDLDGGPAVDHPAVHSVDGDAVEVLRYAPQPPDRFRWLRRSLVALVVLALVAGGVWGGYRWTQQQYFVAPYRPGPHGTGGRSDTGYRDSDRVAIYRGISPRVPGLQLASTYEIQKLTLGSLPTYQRRMLAESISADGLADARAVVGRLKDVAAKCAAPAGSVRGRLSGHTPRSALSADPQIPSECAGVGTPTPTPAPSATADTPSPTGTPSHTGTPSPTGTAPTKTPAKTPTGNKSRDTVNR